MNGRQSMNSADDGSAAAYACANRHHDLNVWWQNQIGAGTEFDQSNSFAQSYTIAGTLPANYSSREDPGNLFANNCDGLTLYG
jgi:hypothetical protein